MVDTVRKNLHSQKFPPCVSRLSAGVSYALVSVAQLIGCFALIGVLAVYLGYNPEGLSTREKVLEANSFSLPHRTAIAFACRENTLRTGMPMAELRLETPSEYQSLYGKSVTTEVESETKARVIVVYKQIGYERAVIQDGDTVVYTGTCRPGGVSWEVSGTVPKKYLPTQ